LTENKTVADTGITPLSMGLVGTSPMLYEVARKIAIFRQTPRNVLILGESGTGKELVARALHQAGAFRAVNCASFRANPVLLESTLFGHVKGSFTGAERDRKGVFEEVEGGIVFLDEINHLSSDVQVSILRTIQEKVVTRIGSTAERPVKFRLIAAAKPDLELEVEKGHFRLDLYYRIRSATILVPPLRDRTEDVGPLVDHFCQRWCESTGKQKSFSARAIRSLEQYPWPGNVRELENIVYELLDLTATSKIGPDDLDPRFFSQKRVHPLPGQLSLRRRIGEVERSHIRAVLQNSRSLREAARKMEISPPSLIRLMRKHGLQREE
jgi:DNA-binding NtrC family response regulator